MPRLNHSILFFAFIALITIPIPGSATEYSTIQLTTSSGSEFEPRINDKAQVTWYGWDGEDFEIYFYQNGAVTQITDNAVDDIRCNISEDGQAVWQAWDGNDWEIFLYDGNSTLAVTDNAVDDTAPQICNNGTVVWQTATGSHYNLKLWDGVDSLILTPGSSLPGSFDMSETCLVTWESWDGTDWEIFFHDGTETVQLTDNSWDDISPNISVSGKVAWKSKAPEGDFILVKDIFGVRTVAEYYSGSHDPKVNKDGYVLWNSRTNWEDAEIFLFDGLSTTQITDNPYHDGFYILTERGQAGWEGYDGSDWEIYLYNGAGIFRVTDNSGDDYAMDINSQGLAVWESWGASPGRNQSDIFMVRPLCDTPVGENVLVDIVPDSSIPGSVAINFSVVLECGYTVAAVGSMPEPWPEGFTPGNPPLYWDLTTTADFVGSMDICITYAGISFSSPNSLSMMQLTSPGKWNNITTDLLPQSQKICGQTSSTMPVTIVQPESLVVRIDVRPGNNTDPVNLTSNGKIPVVVHGDAGFQVRDLDVLSLTLAGAPTARRGNGSPIASFSDFDGDGFEDLMTLFETPTLLSETGHDNLIFKGWTHNGLTVTGSDRVWLVPRNGERVSAVK
jgi:hypothetical protein